MKYFLTLLCTSSILFSSDFYYEYGKKVEVNKLANTKALSSNDKMNTYSTNTGKTIKFRNEIIVRCKKNSICNDELEEAGLTNYIQRSSTYFFIKLDNNVDIFSIMQELDEKEDILSAHPNYIVNKVKR